jgi:hypothetical protein
MSKQNPSKLSRSEYMKEWRHKNKSYSKDYYNENKVFWQNYYETNKEILKIKQQIYIKKNKEKLIERRKEKNNDNFRKYQREYCKNKRMIDINYKIRHNLRARLTIAIKNNQKSGSAVKDLGCSISELKIHLESLFKLGMTWENYGEWEIDHIEPLCSFDLTIRDNLLKVCKYVNLQPIWKEDHCIKSIEDLKLKQ